MGTEQRPLRRDAQRNRDRLTVAAREVFGARGVDAPLDEVARRAGVSIGTLYNHFPRRDALIDAAFVGYVLRAVEIAEEANRIEDPWRAFTELLTRTVELQAADRGYTDVCARSFPQASAINAAKERFSDAFREIVERAKRAGVLRADFAETDLAFVTWGMAGTSESTRQVAPHAWRRHLAFLLDGFRAESASPIPEPPLDTDTLMRAMATDADR